MMGEWEQGSNDVGNTIAGLYCYRMVGGDKVDAL